MQVLYLVFNEGYVASAGASLVRVDLAAEGIRLARLLRRLLPADAEVAGLLALMLLTEARRPARVSASGELVPCWNRTGRWWDASLIARGVSLVAATLAPVARWGRTRSRRRSRRCTTRPRRSSRLTGSRCWRCTPCWIRWRRRHSEPWGGRSAVAQVHGADAGLAVVASVAADPALARSHRLYAVRAQLREMAGSVAEAVSDYRLAATYATNLAEKRYLQRRLASLVRPVPNDPGATAIEGGSPRQSGSWR